MNFPRLLTRWDIEPEEQASLPFDRIIAIVNLRRIEVLCLLAIVTDLIGLCFGVVSLPIVIGIPFAMLIAAASRIPTRWTNLRAQQAVILIFFTFALLMRMWGAISFSDRGLVTPGYQLAMLTLTMMFVLRPKTLAIIMGTLMILYAGAIWPLAITPARKVLGFVDAVIVWGIAQVAGCLIYGARRDDYVQKRQIDAQNDRLLEQNRELDQLMAITAHDLRSPLYGLRNLLDLATRRAPEDPELAYRVMRDGIFSLDQMLALVTRLLDAHSAEHAALVAPVREDVRPHLRAAARRIAPRAEAATVPIVVTVPDIPLIATFDRGALAQILDNLLSNAVRFSPANSAVRLMAGPGPDRISIEVEDHGPGFDPAARATMFSKFARGGDGAGDKAGTGMGLFIAATFAGRMGATLGFRDGEPTGAVFALDLMAAEQA